MTWIITENQKLAVSNVSSARGPRILTYAWNQTFLHYQLRKGFKKFLKHADTLSEPFQTFYSVRLRPIRKDNKESSTSGPKKGNDSKTKANTSRKI